MLLWFCYIASDLVSPVVHLSLEVFMLTLEIEVSRIQNPHNTDSWVFIMVLITMCYWLYWRTSVCCWVFEGAKAYSSILFYHFPCSCLQRGISNVVPCHCCSNTTLPGLVDMVAELVQYVGWISTMGLRLERNSTFLLYFILEFYGIVCIPVILSFFWNTPKAVCIF